MSTAAPGRVHVIPTPKTVTDLGGHLTLGDSVQSVLTISGVQSCLLTSVFGPAFLPPVRASDGGSIAAAPASDLPAHGYRLNIDQAVLIEYADEPGLRSALVTLKHLIAASQSESGPCALPRVLIQDSPAFFTRGVMLDVSRTRVPTMDEIRAIVRTLADLKINHLQFYTEHTFAYAGHEAAWADSSPLTASEVRQIDVWCRECGIELAANQNCFGHLAHWLRLPQYAHLAETHGDWIFDVWPRHGPFSLCPTDDKSLAFVQDLLGQLTPNFTSPLVNIGADETYDIAYGRSAEAVAKRGRAAVYLDFVRKISDAASALGKRPMFWADIALHEPTCITDIPPQLLSLAWGYEPHSPFAEWISLLAAAGRESWVCPGTSSWRSITGRSTERNGNLSAAAACTSATGYLICDWGDTGHHQQWPIALHAIAHGAQAAWSGTTSGELSTRIAAQLYGRAHEAVGPWLEKLGDTDVALRQVAGRLSRPFNESEFALWNQSALFADLHNCVWGDRPEVGSINLWLQTSENIAAMRRTLPAALPELLADELRHTLAMAELAADRAVARREKRSDLTIKADLSQRITELMAEHSRLWHLRSRPGGLAQSNSFWHKVQAGMVQA